MSGPSYRDVYDYDNLTAAAGSDASEEQIMNIHNMLVWHTYLPREIPVDDKIVCCAIERAAAAKHTRLREIKDEDILELVTALF